MAGQKRARHVKWSINGLQSNEGGREVAHPGVLEFAVRGGDGELEEIPVSTKPGLTDVSEQGIMAHKANCGSVVREGKLHHLLYGHIRQVVTDTSSCQRSDLVIRRDEDLKSHSYGWILHEHQFAAVLLDLLYGKVFEVGG